MNVFEVDAEAVRRAGPVLQGTAEELVAAGEWLGYCQTAARGCLPELVAAVAELVTQLSRSTFGIASAVHAAAQADAASLRTYGSADSMAANGSRTLLAALMNPPSAGFGGGGGSVAQRE